jgi:segregation and condensation protein B
LPDEQVEELVEAALYAAGKPLTLDELCKAAGTTSRRKALDAVRRVSARVNANFKAIEVTQVGESRYVLQLRKEFNPVAKKFATQQLLTRSVLKTLTMIAYFQPVSGSKLSTKKGSQVYEHLRILESMGFIASTIEGKNHLYRTTPFFSEYFGLPSDPSSMKRKLDTLFEPATSGKP